jgi:molybdopterin/thiamine biosynthesis adenylyltransferase
MIVTLPDNLLREALSPGMASVGRLYGRIVDADVVQVQGVHPPGAIIGHWAIVEQLDSETAAYLASDDGAVVLLITRDQQIAAFLYDAGVLVPLSIQLVRLQADYTARMQGMFESDALATAQVAIIGLGSGGSTIAVQLARCGVGALRLVDYDRLEVHNIARHACGLADIGRYKTRAVAELLRALSPLVTVETIEADVLEQPDALARAIDGCDLVIVATDREAPKLATNRACWQRQIPAVYGAAYNRAFGGDVFRAMPPDGACYACFHDQATDLFATAPAPSDDFTPGYADPARMADLLSEPGLPIDIGMIALLTARVALHVLLRGRTTLPDLPANYLMFGNRAEWVFEKPLEAIFVAIERRANCAVCDYAGFVRSQLDGTPEQIDQQANDILRGLQSDHL